MPLPFESLRLCHCSVLQCIVARCNMLQCVAVCCSMLQHVAVQCVVLQCVAVCCSVTYTENVFAVWFAEFMQVPCTAVSCNEL